MLKKGLSFIASEDYSLGFTALKRIVMIRFSLQGRHVFTALKKWTFSCRHLASLLLGSLWKKKKRIIFLHVCTRYRYMFDIFLKQISWPRLPSPPFSSLSQLIGIHRRCNGIFARRSIALDALTHATCNNFPHYNWKNPPKKHPTSQFQKAFCSSPSMMFLSMSSAKAENWRLPWGQVRGGAAIISTSSCMFWEANCIKNILNTYTIYSVHICIIYVIFPIKISESHLPLPSPIHIPFQQSAPAFAASQKR